MSKRKYTYEDVRDYFSSVDYVLLTEREEYASVVTPLKVRCPKGHIYTTFWRSFFSGGNRCKKCVAIGIERVKEEFGLEGYKVLSEVYSNEKSKIECECPNGHICWICWDKWKIGRRCLDCKRGTFNHIVSVFKDNGYAVLSDESEYFSGKSKIRFLCPNGHHSSMCWYSFRKGTRCKECAHTRKRTAEEIKKAVLSRGYIFVSTGSSNKKRYIVCICPKGHEQKVLWCNFIKGQGCRICSRGNVSRISQKWLDSLGIPKEFREYRIKELGLRVDGFDPVTNTVYEFLGDYWHGNPKIFSPEEINRVNKRTFGELHKEWLSRKKLLVEKGFKVKYIWESSFLS